MASLGAPAQSGPRPRGIEPAVRLPAISGLFILIWHFWSARNLIQDAVMQLGDMLIAAGLARRTDITAALERQVKEGGRLGENLIAMGLATADQIAEIVNGMPAIPTAIAESGISERNLLYLLLKFMYVDACETVLELADRMKLPRRLIQQLIEASIHQRYLSATGATSDLALSTHYALTEAGRNAAKEAQDQSLYMGPAPVSLTDYREQIEKQRITNEMMDEATLRRGFSGLVVPENMFRRLLPAINAGRSVLLYGPPGNGKTTLSTRIAGLFKDIVYIPYAVEVAGQIIKVHDVQIHKPHPQHEAPVLGAGALGLQRETFDQRWVACSRPVVMTGGEMTLEMLDLQWNSEARFYDAPLHVKALNGMMLVDDFGRQKFAPNDLLNRWIVPMESQIDFMKLNTGASFTLPFDVLLMFSTNLQPADLMDPAFLRRIQYKIKLFEPTRDEFHRIFSAVSKSRGLTFDEDVFDYVVRMLASYGLAYYQPAFICNHVLETCRSFGLPPLLTNELAGEAMANLYVDIEEKLGLADEAAG
jgi:energy-coupling factor transporter ATP-binding protein EcfA2